MKKGDICTALKHLASKMSSSIGRQEAIKFILLLWGFIEKHGTIAKRLPPQYLKKCCQDSGGNHQLHYMCLYMWWDVKIRQTAFL
jgi:hypothetical protein